ncbi:HAD hydrolase family protein [Candidatus Woesearchaeota archaeon]|nr:HAD hydrolase family protein [Candidatus Woesearchaeota archaeon]
MNDKIMIMRGDASVEVSILTKDQTVKDVAEEFGCPLDEIAVVGDGSNDLPMLTMEGLGLRGAPANAEQKVKEALEKLDNSYISPRAVCDGFFDIYQKAIEKGIKVVVTDRDGVLKAGSQVHWGPDFAKLALEMGGDKPYVVVVTAASHAQNVKFMEEYGLDGRLHSNPHVRAHPYIMLAEGGAVHVNVLTGGTRNYVSKISPELLALMKGKFEQEVRKLIDAQLPSLGLTWTKDYDDQMGKVYHVEDKQCMVCFNVPRTFTDGRPYRKSPESAKLRDVFVDAMVEVAEKLGMRYEFF